MPQPRRVLIFSFAYYPRFVGGTEVAVKAITDRISPSAIEFDLVTLRLDSRLPRTEKIGNVTVHRVGWSTVHHYSIDALPWYLGLNKYLLLLTGTWKALSLHRRRRYDAIWSLMATYASFAAILFEIRHPHVPFLFTLQDGDPIPFIQKRARPLYPLFKMMFTHANHVQAISRHLADWARDMGSRCPIDVVPNAVDYELFSAKIPPAEAQVLKEKLGKREGEVWLVTTSRLVAKNGLGDVIRALPLLPPNVKFLVLGEGSLEAGLRTLAHELNVTDRIIWVGYVPQADMPPYLQISDIFIRPALSEGLGNSFLEAMAAGLPVIATPVGGIPDFLTDGETGFFCRINDPQSIASTVHAVMGDPRARERTVRNAREMVKDTYNWQATTAKMQLIFESLFQTSRSRVP
jgi:glycosyltransferase involved in cell wall biosynthesis